jgi:hypothetical protein
VITLQRTLEGPRPREERLLGLVPVVVSDATAGRGTEMVGALNAR